MGNGNEDGSVSRGDRTRSIRTSDTASLRQENIAYVHSASRELSVATGCPAGVGVAERSSWTTLASGGE